MTILDFRKKEFYKKQIDKTERLINTECSSFAMQVDQLSENLYKNLKENHAVLTEKSYMSSSVIVTASCLMAIAASHLNRLTDLEDSDEYKLSSNQLEGLACDLMLKVLRRDKQLQKERVTQYTKQFLDMLSNSRLVKSVEEKETKFKECLNDLNKGLENDRHS